MNERVGIGRWQSLRKPARGARSELRLPRVRGLALRHGRGGLRSPAGGCFRRLVAGPSPRRPRRTWWRRSSTARRAAGRMGFAPGGFATPARASAAPRVVPRGVSPVTSAGDAGAARLAVPVARASAVLCSSRCRLAPKRTSYGGNVRYTGMKRSVFSATRESVCRPLTDGEGAGPRGGSSWTTFTQPLDSPVAQSNARARR